MSKDVFHAISLIDGDLIKEAENAARKVRRSKFSKMVAVAVVAVMLLGFTAFATTIILSGRGGHSYNIPSYYAVPDAQTLQSDIGFAPNVVEKFSNGYSFKSGHIVDNEDYAQDGSVFERYKGLACVYAKENQEVHFHADMAIAGVQIKNTDKKEIYKGSELLYCAYTNKLVPPDYKMTEQDKKDEKSGKFVFSWGSPEVKISEVQLLAWEYNGVNYELNVIDSSMTSEDLIEMAKEIINTQEK